jgi:hypothetical protein
MMPLVGLLAASVIGVKTRVWPGPVLVSRLGVWLSWPGNPTFLGDGFKQPTKAHSHLMLALRHVDRELDQADIEGSAYLVTFERLDGQVFVWVRFTSYNHGW